MSKVMMAALALLTTLAAYGTTGQKARHETIPPKPQYSDHTQWYVSNRQAEADIFYIVSTETGDYPLADGRTGHYADTYSDSLRAPLHAEMKGVDSLLSGRLNFYAPYYRQCSLQSFQSDSLARRRLGVPMDDVRRAFRHYLTTLNGGRPFILAGFSQGAMLMLQLQKEMDGETRSRMIAAYAIGVTIPDSILGPSIVPARGADDTGVTVCYNSVRDNSCALPGWQHSAAAINPVNWRTDGMPATLVTEPSPLLPVDQQRKDTLTVSLDTTTGLLTVGGYTAKDYVLPLIGKEGNYHSREIWLYRQQLRENMALRAEAYLNPFVNLTDAVPDAILEIRYHSTYNFVGARVDGYEEPTALLTRQAAKALKAVSDDVAAQGYRLKIYDAYRPQKAVDHFVRWAQNLTDTTMRPYFYPDVDKSLLFAQDYIAEKSGHTRGSTVDLTLFDMATGKELDMGGTFDWFGPESHPDFCGDPATGHYTGDNSKSPATPKRAITAEQFNHRMILRRAMLAHGFKPIDSEWWHFTLSNEPYPDTYFNHPVKRLAGK